MDVPDQGPPPVSGLVRGWKMMMLDRKPIVMVITAFAIAGAAGCATVPEPAWSVPEVHGVEEEVVCSGACEEEWGRAEEWIKKHSGYPFPAEVTVTRDQITAARLPFLNCVSVPQSRRQFLAGCSRPPLASEPLGIGFGEQEPGSRVGKLFADAGPHWQFLVRRQAMESGSFRIRLAQRCLSESGPKACDSPELRRSRQDRFRRFVRTGELLSP